MKMEKRVTKSELRSHVNDILSTDKDLFSSIKKIKELIDDKESIVIDDDDYYFIGFDFDFEMNKLIIILETEFESLEFETKEYLEFSW